MHPTKVFQDMVVSGKSRDQNMEKLSHLCKRENKELTHVRVEVRNREY